MKLFFGCLLAGALVALPTVRAANVPPTIVAFGDSTTAPRAELVVYATLLEASLTQRLAVPVKVVNAGVRGNTTTDAAKRFESDVLAIPADLVIIQFGINDSAIDVWKQPPATQPRVSLADYRANLTGFITALRARGIRVVLMTPNPLAWTPKLIEMYGHPPYDANDPQGFNLNLFRYADAMRELAAETNTPLVDVMRAHEKWHRNSKESLLSDGMHPNERGHELVAGLLVDLIIADQLHGTASPR